MPGNPVNDGLSAAYRKEPWKGEKQVLSALEREPTGQERPERAHFASVDAEKQPAIAANDQRPSSLERLVAGAAQDGQPRIARIAGIAFRASAEEEARSLAAFDPLG